MLLNDHISEQARKHALELIDRNAQAQAQLVNDLVDMSRMTTGKLQVELEPLPVVPVSKRRSRACAGSAGQGDRDSHLVARAGRQRPGRRHSPAAGVVESVVQCGQVHAQWRPHLGERRPGRRAIQIEVTDTGIGIDPAFCHTCSIASGRPTARRRVDTVVSGSAWRSFTIWFGCTEATSKFAALASVRERHSS